MAGNSYGQIFRVSTAGESHGPGNVCVIDGVPAGLPLGEDDLRPDLARRRPGQSKIVTQRNEADEPEILAGVFEGRTTGTSIAILIRNQDQRSRDYSDIKDKYRPGHADFTFDAKYGFRDYRGGGRSSARETSVRVAAGAVAKKLLQTLYGTRVLGWVDQIGDIRCPSFDPAAVTLEQVEATPVRCPCPETAEKMIERIEAVRAERDSIGGAATLVALPVPAGLGEPVFDKLKADLGKALFSLPAVMGVEYGQGFGVVNARGTDHSDTFVNTPSGQHPSHTVGTQSNRHGGMLGGISSGMPIVMRAAVKPTSSIPQDRPTVDREGNATTIATRGRHDPCLLPRFIPMAEAMMAITLADHALRQASQQVLRPDTGR